MALYARCPVTGLMPEDVSARPEGRGGTGIATRLASAWATLTTLAGGPPGALSPAEAAKKLNSLVQHCGVGIKDKDCGERLDHMRGSIDSLAAILRDGDPEQLSKAASLYASLLQVH